MLNTSEIKALEEEFNDKIKVHLRYYYWDCLGLYDWERRIKARKNEIPRAKAWLKAIEKISKIDLKNKKMLDIGCGWGGHIAAGAQLGAYCTGCDTDRGVLEVAELRAKLCGIEAEFVHTAAEKLPFGDNEFDYVQAVSVLEHVRDVTLSIKEMIRVLKPEGIGFIQTPNYFIPVEPHYKIVFPSKCFKPLAKMYLKLLARPTEFIDSINYTDYRMIKNMLESSGAAVSDICDEFRNISRDYYLSLEIPKEGSCIKIPLCSYNALVGKLMSRGSTVVGNFFQNVLKVKNIFFIFKKQNNETCS